MKKLFYLVLAMPIFASAQSKFTETDIAENIKGIKVNSQITLAYSKLSGVKIIMKDGLPFKDLKISLGPTSSFA